MTSVYSEIKVVGLKEAIKALNDIDKKARRQLTKDYKQIVQPVIDEAKRRIPNNAPISGWERNWNPANKARGGGSRRVRKDAWEEVQRAERARQRREGPGLTPWQSSLAEKNIKAKVSGKKPREFLIEGRSYMANLAVFSIAFAGATNAIYDLAGRTSRGATKAGANMIRGLEARHGKASRVLWPAYDMHRDDVVKGIQELIDQVLRQVNREV
jgi:hypothetical protein